MAITTDLERSHRRASLVFVGIFASIAAALMALLLVGELLGILVLVMVLGGAVVVAGFAGPRTGKVTLAALTVLLVASIAVVGIGLAQIAAAIFAGGSTAGTAEAADPAELFAAEAKIRVAARDAGFRLELTEQELNAVLQHAIAEGDTPLRRVAIDITNDIGDPGRIAFAGAFKSGDVTMAGTMSARVVAGEIDIELVDADMGMFTLPGVGRRAVEDMIESVADLQDALADETTDIQEITIGADRIIVTGVNRGPAPVDAAEILAVRANALDLTPESVEAIPRFGPGRAEGTRWPGSPIYLALGDSLAANVGVDDTKLGYVSRFHAVLEDLDEMTYGMVNLGVSGETSGSLLHEGQLDAAFAIAESADVRYVTIDIGANDLLGHLGSPICSENLQSVECQQRIEASFTSYERNIAEIFDAIAEALPKATVVFLSAYNPFSYGFGDAVPLETAADASITRLNTIATLAAVERGFIAADGFSPMQGTVAQTTRMNEAEPDVHPTALGYDVLTGALLDALLQARGES